MTGRTLALAALVTALDCARPGRATADPRARTDARRTEPPLTVAVENHNSADVVVTLIVQNGTGRRLGTVGGNHTVTFTVPGAVLGGTQSVVFVAHAIGGRGSYTSETVTVSGGRRAVWTLENGFARSIVEVY